MGLKNLTVMKMSASWIQEFGRVPKPLHLAVCQSLLQWACSARLHARRYCSLSTLFHSPAGSHDHCNILVQVQVWQIPIDIGFERNKTMRYQCCRNPKEKFSVLRAGLWLTTSQLEMFKAFHLCRLIDHSGESFVVEFHWKILQKIQTYYYQREIILKVFL